MNRYVELRMSALVVLAGVAWLYGASLIHVEMTHQLVNEASLPIAIGVILVVLGSVLVVRQFRALSANPPATAPTRDKADEPEYPVSNWRPLVVAAVSLAWVVLLEDVGFIPMTMLSMAAILWLMEFRRPGRLVVVSVATALLIYMFVDVMLRVSLPGGLVAPITDSLHLTWHL